MTPMIPTNSSNWVARACFALTLAAAFAAAPAAQSQQQFNAQTPAPFRGVETHVEGVFVTPIPNEPLSATVLIESSQQISDGSFEIKRTFNNIARDYRGRIYNERRAMMPDSFNGTPPLIRYHIYDPNTHANTFLDPNTGIAAQRILPNPPAQMPATNVALRKNTPQLYEEDLGTQTMNDVQVRGTRRTHIIPSKASGTGQEVVVVDEFWYSDELRLNLKQVHNDPRTGEQTVTITKISRTEPDPSIFEIPSDYKIVDETPERR